LSSTRAKDQKKRKSWRKEGTKCIALAYTRKTSMNDDDK
jgi:hypothetical protein